ncbi:MAG: agglutinin biogenesis protein MshI [Betaproteobacteria bacterium]|nr:agglutinin biogenesis protein MshI [Betaproteobacteria bacterium]
MAVSLRPGAVDFVHGHYAAGGKAVIDRCGTRAYEGDFGAAARTAAELQIRRYNCSTLLDLNEYQMLLVEAPKVSPSELRTAVRWRVKDMIDYHVDDATIDVLDIPPDPSGPPRGHAMYVVAARNDVIRTCIERFERAHIPLAVIEIAETAQRNLAALIEPEARGVAMLYLGADQGLLTVNFRGELYLARRIEIGLEQVNAAATDARQELFHRIALELQRTFDHFDRQYPSVPIARLALAPHPEDVGLIEFLSSNLDVPVEPVRLSELVAFAAPERLDAASEWRLFHLVGAALRHDNKAL